MTARDLEQQDRGCDERDREAQGLFGFRNPPHGARRSRRGRLRMHFTRHEAASEPFGWEIVCKADGSEVARSSRTFSTRVEALMDSARAAAFLILGDPRHREADSI